MLPLEMRCSDIYRKDDSGRRGWLILCVQVAGKDSARDLGLWEAAVLWCSERPFYSGFGVRAQPRGWRGRSVGPGIGWLGEFSGQALGDLGFNQLLLVCAAGRSLGLSGPFSPTR